jgi:uncharacterized protein YbbC (DUF1343 family)
LTFGVLVTACAASAPTPVRPGIDVLLTDSIQLVRGRRVGLLTNRAGVDAAGVDDETRLRDAGIAITAIFSPEHGPRGLLDVENIGSSIDSATGVPIYSLYGARRAPSPEMLATVDVLLVDLQDVGARPYTYVTTTLLALAAAGRSGVPLVLLDRPNPIGGALVQGPVLDTAFASFNGLVPIPLRHGMTLGELVRLGRDELSIAGALTVVPMRGWRRDMWFDATGLPWIAPSPSMPSLESAAHYPGFVIFEATNVSVGRGTPIAFQVLAAPWLDAPGLARRLGDEPGVRARDTTITPVDPTDGKYPGTTLPAVRFHVTDRAHYDPVRLTVRILADLQSRFPDSLRVNEQRMRELAGVDLWGSLRDGARPAAIVGSWSKPIEKFQTRRRPHLLYVELP